MANEVSCKEIADALGVQVAKASQAWRPALEKFARVFRAHPVGVQLMLAEALEDLEAEESHARKRKDRPLRPRRLRERAG